MIKSSCLSCLIGAHLNSDWGIIIWKSRRQLSSDCFCSDDIDDDDDDDDDDGDDDDNDVDDNDGKTCSGLPSLSEHCAVVSQNLATTCNNHTVRTRKKLNGERNVNVWLCSVCASLWCLGSVCICLVSV